MRLRIIDYVGNAGGGVRFAIQLLRALAGASRHIDLTLVSHGDALTRYRSLLDAESVACATLDVPPTVDRWCYSIPATALRDCDQAWLPWLHRHGVPEGTDVPVVASFHDAILFERERLFSQIVPAESIEQERQLTRRWFSSDATIAVSAHATVASLGRLFGTSPDRFAVVPISGDHSRPVPREPRQDWPWARRPFLLCPANVCPHKNHETLFRGVALWGCKLPLALTGQATHLHLCKWHRAIELRNLATELGFKLHDTLHPLGYVDDTDYYSLLSRAHALVMPTLAEGGGSFPVAEAIHLGVPVLCSDIPPVREQVERMNAQVLWFDPHNPHDLAAKLHTLDVNYAHYKTQAERQVAHLRRRSWDDVARDYCDLFVARTDNRGSGPDPGAARNAGTPDGAACGRVR